MLLPHSCGGTSVAVMVGFPSRSTLYYCNLLSHQLFVCSCIRLDESTYVPMRTPGEERGTHTRNLFLCRSLVDGDPFFLNQLFEEEET